VAGLRRDRRRAGFERFVAESSASLLRTAYLVTGDPGQAEDLVQETLLSIARRWPRVATMDSPRAYARRILVNLALDGSRRRSRQRAELERGASPDGAPPLWWGPDPPAGAFGRADDRLDLIRALAELAPRQRAVLVLRFLDDLSEAEVASTLGCSVGTVKSTTARALAKMRGLVPNRSRPEPAHDV